MNHLNIDIQEASWLDEGQKEKLIKLYDANKAKDGVRNAFTVLGLFDGLSADEPKEAMITAMRLLSLEGANKVTNGTSTTETGDIFQSIYNFFDVLDDREFEKIIEIYKVYNYAYTQKGSIDEQIQQLT